MKERAVLDRTIAKRERRSRSAGASLYEPMDWVMVRAPLLPVQAYVSLQGWTPKLPHTANGVSEMGSLTPVDDRVRTAIAVGSDDLLEALERSATGREAVRLRGKLLRYLIRMSTRPTPYGLFAGVALAGWGETTDLKLEADAPRTRTRPDAEWLLGLIFELEGRPEIRERLRLVANPTAFVHAGRVFLSERASGAGSSPEESAPVSIRATEAVRRALAMARSPVPYERVVSELASLREATPEKVEALVGRLCELTILMTDLRPPLTVPSPARYAADRLLGIPEAANERHRLEAVLEAAVCWDERPWDLGSSGYRRLMAVAQAVRPEASSSPLQVDMALPIRGRIAHAVGEEAARAAELLLRMTPSPTGPGYLEAYRHAFEGRYGVDRDVPLLEVLDADFGLGPAGRHGGFGARADPHAIAVRQQTLRDLAVAAVRDRARSVELDDELLARLQTWTPDPGTAPISLELSVFVVAPSEEAIDRGDFLVVVGPNLGASAAGRNLGRFADLLGSDGERALRSAAAAEAAHAPGRLWAEVVYLPRRLRSANVAIRPLVRPYEIAVDTAPGEAPDGAIPLDELVLSVRWGRLSIRWPARNAEVVPCAGHMLNTMAAPEVCRFLDAVGHDRVAQISSFDWGPAWGFPFLPRVQRGRIVLSPAQWLIDARTGSGELGGGAPDRFRQDLGTWRDRWQVPRHVYLSVGDNRLMLDLEDTAQAEELRGEIERLGEGAQLVLQEALPSPEHAWLPGPGGRFLAELVVPLVLRGAPTRSDGAPGRAGAEAARAPLVAAEPVHAPMGAAEPVRASAIGADDRTRLRPPGSDWLFAKLYCPPSFEEDVIVGPMRDLCEGVLLSRIADAWFFIRYADPEPHIRLRFRGSPGRLVGDLIPQVCSWAGPLMDEGALLRFGFDTYDREVERYGGAAGAAAAEDLFAADSRAVVEVLSLVRERSTALDMTTLAILSIDDLLAGLGLSEGVRTSWYRERVASRRETGDEYRRRQKDLRALLGDPGELGRRPGGTAIGTIFSSRREALAPVARHLHELVARGELGQPMASLYRNFVHLHCNRLAGGDRSLEERALGLLLRTRHGLDRAPVLEGA